MWSGKQLRPQHPQLRHQLQWVGASTSLALKINLVDIQ